MVSTIYNLFSGRVQVSVRPEALHTVGNLLLDVLWGILSPSTYRPSIRDPQIPHHLLLHRNWWVFEIRKPPLLIHVLVFVYIVYYFIGIGQWSKSYYKSTVSQSAIVFIRAHNCSFYRVALREDLVVSAIFWLYFLSLL